MRISLDYNTMQLNSEPVQGRRTHYLSFTFGSRVWWLMRWDVERAPKTFLRSRDGLMGWSCGLRRIPALKGN